MWILMAFYFEPVGWRKFQQRHNILTAEFIIMRLKRLSLVSIQQIDMTSFSFNWISCFALQNALKYPKSNPNHDSKPNPIPNHNPELINFNTQPASLQNRAYDAMSFCHFGGWTRKNPLKSKIVLHCIDCIKFNHMNFIIVGKVKSILKIHLLSSCDLYLDTHFLHKYWQKNYGRNHMYVSSICVSIWCLISQKNWDIYLYMIWSTYLVYRTYIIQVNLHLNEFTVSLLTSLTNILHNPVTFPIDCYRRMDKIWRA